MLDPIFIFDRHQSKKHITSHRIASHRITSHRIASHHITSHRITSHHIASHRIASHYIASHRIASHHIASHRIISPRIASHHITSHRIASHRIASHHITSHRIASHHIASHHIPRPSLFLTPSLFLIAHDQSRIKTQVKNKDNRGQKNLPQSPPAETSRHQPKSVAISRNQSPSAEISRHHQPKSVATSHRGGGGPLSAGKSGGPGPASFSWRTCAPGWLGATSWGLWGGPKGEPPIALVVSTQMVWDLGIREL